MKPWEIQTLRLTAALSAAVLVKLARSGLASTYRLLFLYVFADALTSLAATVVP